MKSLTAKVAAGTTALVALALALANTPFAQAAAPEWNVTGNYVMNMNYLGTDYPHDMSLTQDSSGNLTGHGGSPAGANVYTWVITSGFVSGNTIDFFANYTATADAVTPQTTLHATGTIALNGTMSGTWSDNYQGGSREGTWTTISGTSTPITRTLTYAAGPHGSLTGSTTQMIANGTDGSPVTAVADSGFHFVSWSDTSTANPRTDTDVAANLTVTALFAANTPTPSPTPIDKDDCKKGGWATLLNTLGVHFKNQGQCVSSANHQNHVNNPHKGGPTTVKATKTIKAKITNSHFVKSEHL